MKKLVFILLLLCLSSNAFAQNKCVLLENLTWQKDEKALKPETVVIIPLGAAAKDHSPASEAEKRLDDGRVLQKASVESRRHGD